MADKRQAAMALAERKPRQYVPNPFDVLDRLGRGIVPSYAGARQEMDQRGIGAPEVLRGAIETFGPQADVNGFYEGVRGATDAISKRDAAKALQEAGNAGLSAMGLSELTVPTKAIFAGVAARNADLEALAKAKVLSSRGVSRDTIWRDTGWMEGSDGKWRFEINDSASEVMGSARTANRMDQALDHPELYDAYPELSDYEFQPTSGNPRFRGSFNPMEERVKVNLDAEKPRATMLHELQHAVQELEGFSGGANPRMFGSDDSGFNEAFNKVYDRKYKLQRSIDPTATDFEIDRAIKDDVLKEAQYNLYKRAPGEVEARNAAKRMNMTEDQRRNPPWWTED